MTRCRFCTQNRHSRPARRTRLTADQRLSREWRDLMKVPVTEALVARAEAVAWTHGLRGCDAVQLASALTWRDVIGQEVVLATFGRQLWEAAPHAGLRAWPSTLPT